MMMPSAKMKGPASAATDPDHGSNVPAKGKSMNAQTNTTKDAQAATLSAILEANEALGNIGDLARLLALAGEALTVEYANAMVCGAYLVIEEVEKTKALLDNASGKLATWKAVAS